jgi:hypothetical protein
VSWRSATIEVRSSPCLAMPTLLACGLDHDKRALDDPGR